MQNSGKNSVDRRDFLKLAASTAAIVASTSPVARSEEAAGPTADATESKASVADGMTTNRPGSDFMVDVLKSIGFEYVCSNPGSSFRSLQESVVNYGGNKNPEFLTCCHEESSVAMGHGY